MRFRLSVTLLAFGALGAGACAELPDAPQSSNALSLSISDAVHNNGNRRFFFLPPLVSQPATYGVFDPGLSPVVEICEWSGSCGGVVASFSAQSGTGGATLGVDVSASAYFVNWDTRVCATGPCTLDPQKTYRLRVLLGSTELGHADVDVVSSGAQLRNVQSGEYIGLVNGRTLPVRFRIDVEPDEFDFIGSSCVGGMILCRLTGEALQEIPWSLAGGPERWAWSPDGEELAIQWYSGGTYAVSLMNVDGSGLRLVAPQGGFPQWAPTGRRLAYLDAGGRPRVLDLATGATTTFPALESQPWGAGALKWSPDGRYIALSGGMGLWILDLADGSAWEALGSHLELSPEVVNGGVPAGEPAWSPDSRQLALQVNFSGSPPPATDGPGYFFGGVYVVNRNGSGLRRVAWLHDADVEVVGMNGWAPSELILFSDINAWSDGRQRVFVVDGQGLGLRQITDVPGDLPRSSAWSPDGRWVVVPCCGPGGMGFVTRPDGTGLHSLVAAASRFAWNPTLRRLP